VIVVRDANPESPPIFLLYRDRTGRIDGIGDYCERLESALRTAGADAYAVTWRSRGIDVSEGTLILQYNPFAYGRWGFAPRLPFEIVSLRRRRPRVRQAVMVHEPFVGINSVKSLVMGIWQRLQLRAVLSTMDVVMISTSSWAPLLPARCHPIAVPVGSNLPDRREQRESARRALGVDSETLVLATFGTGHPSRLLDHLVAAANTVAARSRQVMLLFLGADTSSLDGLDPNISVHRPGQQSVDELAETLSAADIYLAALVDGLSTRRTTLMAALQHALPIVGTYGSLTEPDLRAENDAICWTPTGDPQRFAHACLDLATDTALRQRYGAAARALYDRRFSWELIAELVLAALSTSASSQ